MNPNNEALMQTHDEEVSEVMSEIAVDYWPGITWLLLPDAAEGGGK